MRIHEVEKQVGMSKKNIRFYESKGLLKPNRDGENGYRDYGEGDIKILNQIKLLRKLGLPLEEIKNMQKGNSTVGDSMRRHLVTLEREKENLTRSEELCNALKEKEILLQDLEAETVLEDMAALEKRGAKFKNIKKDMKARSYLGATLVFLSISLLLVGLALLLKHTFKVSPEEGIPSFVVWGLILLPIVIILSLLWAYGQRLKEIREGEMEDAKYY